MRRYTTKISSVILAAAMIASSMTTMVAADDDATIMATEEVISEEEIIVDDEVVATATDETEALAGDEEEASVDVLLEEEIDEESIEISADEVIDEEITEETVDGLSDLVVDEELIEEISEDVDTTETTSDVIVEDEDEAAESLDAKLADDEADELAEDDDYDYEDVAEDGASIVIDVTEYGANGSDSKPDGAAIQSALSDAYSYAMESGGISTVRVPAGTYMLERQLEIYSNTRLELDAKATIKRLDDAYCMIASGDTYTGGYEGSKNITITGGKWDGNLSKGSNESNIMYLYHGTNIEISNTTITGCRGYHFIELAGVKNSLIDNVTVTNFVNGPSQKSGTGEGSSEAIQFDYCLRDNSEGALPFDGTKSANIKVNNCKFDNVLGGVGNHHPKKSMTGLSVTNCTFNNVKGLCLYLDNFKKAVVKGNKATNIGGYMIAATKATVTMSDDNVVAPAYAGLNVVQVASGSKVTITNSTIKGSALSAVDCESATVSVSNSTIGNCGKPSAINIGGSMDLVNNKIIKTTSGSLPTVYYKSKGTGTVKGNTISNAHNAIMLDGSGAVTIANNTIKAISTYGILINNVAGNISISGNTIDGDGMGGMQIGDSKTAISISNNTLTNSKVKAIEIVRCTNVNISGNTIVNPVKDGISSQQSTTVIEKNIVDRANRWGISAAGGNVIIRNNSVKGSKGITGGALDIADINVYSGAVGSITGNNITGDPKIYIKAVPSMSVSDNGNKGGAYKEGWQKTSSGKWWYQNADGSRKKSCWAKINGKWYRFDSKGYRQTGWVTVKGKKYYLSSKGVRQTGWVKIKSKWYYFNSKGVMQTGWIKLKGKYYYLYKDGHMAVDTWVGNYHVNSNGVRDGKR